MLKVGQKVITPSGRMATVKSIFSGASQQDPFERVVCQYSDKKGSGNTVTLQQHILKPVDDTNEKLIAMLKNKKAVSVERAAKNLDVSTDSIIALVLGGKGLTLCVCAEEK